MPPPPRAALLEPVAVLSSCTCKRVVCVEKIVREQVWAFFTDLRQFPEASDSACHPAVWFSTNALDKASFYI